MKIKTRELIGVALDWAVCLAAGLIDAYPKHRDGAFFLKAWRARTGGPLRPSTEWSQGGPIIERDDICLDKLPDNGHRAFTRDKTGRQANFMDCWFSTKLETAMRCFVASRLGETVDVPEELLA